MVKCSPAKPAARPGDLGTRVSQKSLKRGQRGRKENFVVTSNGISQLKGSSRSILEGRIFYFPFLTSLGTDLMYMV